MPISFKPKQKKKLLKNSIFSKIPERFSPGMFDYFGQSHQIMHICTFIDVYAHYFLVEKLFYNNSKNRYNPVCLFTGFITVTVIFIIYLARFSKNFKNKYL